ncbi:MAG TPA: S-adenosylmethionine:tRNA ribosyltransferase-isomerase [Blastocatellia bacterium]|jgi:S-adenosylmethionine:tRNA ribosyltransferase-isomerase|nr:S-adenosylmethionine:tRNA ribosyltransferase-isomerase [Blastocatellia bacterium]
MLVSDFDYDLPGRLIAQEPAARREHSRLLVVDRASATFRDSAFEQLPEHLAGGDVLVVNNTRVFPARLLGRRLKARGEAGPGGRVEVFLVSRQGPLVWEALVRPGRAMMPGARVEFAPGTLTGEVIEWRERGRRIIRFEANGDFDEIIDDIGRTPLPPYIKRGEEERLDRERYQTVYARERGAIAAPTAGLHFTAGLLDRLRARGVEVVEVTLHVGYGTFQPVRVDRVEDHSVEPETYSISEEAARSINRALEESRRVVAVGTTTTRALESACRDEAGAVGRKAGSDEGMTASPPLEDVKMGDEGNITFPARPGPVAPGVAATDLFIYPGFKFRVLGGLVTNFHLPQSSLLMLVAAFGGRELILDAYRHAVEREYRFYSYGDGMLIL